MPTAAAANFSVSEKKPDSASKPRAEAASNIATHPSKSRGQVVFSEVICLRCGSACLLRHATSGLHRLHAGWLQSASEVAALKPESNAH